MPRTLDTPVPLTPDVDPSHDPIGGPFASLDLKERESIAVALRARHRHLPNQADEETDYHREEKHRLLRLAELADPPRQPDFEIDIAGSMVMRGYFLTPSLIRFTFDDGAGDGDGETGLAVDKPVGDFVARAIRDALTDYLNEFD